MTNVSISDIEGISYEELDKKIKQISRYIKRVHQRTNAINNFLSAHIKTIDPSTLPNCIKKVDTASIKEQK